ncbi:MAG: hypothetical protein ACRD22_18100 [Terriglobia bacterium]
MPRLLIESVDIADGNVREELVETTPEDDAFYADIRDLIAKLPDSDEVTILILRAHLVIEQLVIRITESLVRNPEHLQKATRLHFSTRLIFLRSLAKPLMHADASYWRSLESLNGMRNNLAHKLDAPSFESSVDTFIAETASILQLSFRPGFKGLHRTSKLKRCLEGLCKFTAGILAATWQERNHGA